MPGLALVALAVLGASAVSNLGGAVPLIMAAVLLGVMIGNVGLVAAETQAGLAFASTTLLRAGIVALGLRLSIADVSGLGVALLMVIVATVVITFFSVQFIGRRMGLSRGLSLLVASGFSICGNSAIASVNAAAPTDDEDVAAAIGLVTLCGTLAIAVVPAVGSALGLADVQLGVWVGAGVQDTAQVVAVASAAGPAVLAIATAVKLTRVLLLAPIVAGVSVRHRRSVDQSTTVRPPLVPAFIALFLGAMMVRSTGIVPSGALDTARLVEQHLLAAGMVGLGSSVVLVRLRRLGLRPLALGAIAWLIVAGVSLGTILAVGV